MFYRTTICISIAVLVLTAAIATAVTPTMMNFQGALFDDLGDPITTPTEVTFSIWDQETGGLQLWSETQTIDPDVTGAFTTLLGNVQSIPDSAFAGDAYLAIQVTGDDEMVPRTKLVAVPTAFRVGTVDGASGGAVNGMVYFVSGLGDSVTIGSGQIVIRGPGGEDDEAVYAADGITVTSGLTGDTLSIGTTQIVIRGTGGENEEAVYAANGVVVSAGNEPAVTVTTNGIVVHGATAADTNALIHSDGTIELKGFGSGVKFSDGSIQFTQAGAANGLPQSGGTMDGTIVNTGDPRIYMGSANFGANNTNTGDSSFVAGANNVADGAVSSISGGMNNVAAADGAAIAGGVYNKARGLYSVVAGGGTGAEVDSNAALGDYSAISGGYANIAEGEASVIGGGAWNVARGNYSVVAGGGNTDAADSNVANGEWSVIGGGAGNQTPGEGAAVPGGVYGLATGDYSVITGGSFNEASEGWTSIGGGWANTADSSYSSIGGGAQNYANGYASVVGGGAYNRVHGFYSVIAGGGSATEADSNSSTGSWATTSGGIRNISTDNYATIGGGHTNTITAAGGTIGGGGHNKAYGFWATVAGGGGSNEVDSNVAMADWACIGGGRANLASGDHSAIAGGGFNRTRGIYSTVSGGGGPSLADSNSALGDFSMILGGRGCVAGDAYSLAAGRRAKAASFGVFAWSDDLDFDFPTASESNFTPGSRMFLARSTGGVVFVTGVDGSGNSTSGVSVAAGGGSWSSLSDRNLKENIQPVDRTALLEKLSTLEISTWNYQAQPDSIRHMGPMAQDLYALFGLGEDNRRITSIDADGIALAAIQALYQKTVELEQKNNELEDIRRRLVLLEEVLQTLISE